MLTADLVLARRRGTELQLVRLSDEDRERARDLAARLVAVVAAHVGRTREELDRAVGALEVGPSAVRWRDGLAKLLDDRCTWDEEAGDAAPALRQAVFLRAAAVRKALAPGARFERGAVLAAVAGELGRAPEDVEAALYADLRGAQTLRGVEPIGPAALAEAWEQGQAQAVLLRAARIVVDVQCASAGVTRALFHRLKFLRLLHTITETPSGHRLTIDGPFSLFESSTRYGLQLALVLPLLAGCDAWTLQADVRWGKERVPLSFRLKGEGHASALESPPLPDEIARLVESFRKLGTAWKVAASGAILELPGIGLCVPDLVFSRGRSKVYLEVMGFWSRDAVWRRVELVQAGLATPILFAVSARLRVSEEVLPADAPGALYVYKGTLSARAIADRLEGLAGRAAEN